MLLTIVILAALLGVAGLSVGVVVRDDRRMHRTNRQLADAPMDAAGASAAGMVFYGSTFSH